MTNIKHDDLIIKYGWFSVQVDQYYSIVRIYGRNHDFFKLSFQDLPSYKFAKTDEFKRLDESTKTWMISTITHFNYMSSTGIFNDAHYPKLKDIKTDMINFGFYTCFCFQWTLFENYVMEAISNLVQKNLVSKEISKKITNLKFKTEKFFRYLETGELFGESPFKTILPIKHIDMEYTECDYEDLERIRKLRNRFIHAVNESDILNISEVEKEKLYEKSMWTLRNFAGNISQSISNLKVQSKVK